MQASPLVALSGARPLARHGRAAHSIVEARALTYRPRRMRTRAILDSGNQNVTLGAGRGAQVQASSRDSSAMASSSGGEGDVGPSLREISLREYAELKGELLGNTTKLGAFISLYLGLTQHDAMALVSTIIGAGGSVAYVALLCWHVDNMTKENVSPMPKMTNPGENLIGLLVTAIKSIGIVYKNALLHPQLLVPVALAAGCSQWNQLDLGPDVLYFDVLIGFFTYKLVVLDQGWKALKKVMFFDKPAPPLPVIPALNEKDDLLN